MTHTFESRIGQLGEKMLSYYFVAVPADISSDYNDHGSKRTIVTIPPLEPVHRALMPYGDGSDYIILNGNEMKKAGLGLGAMVTVHLKADDSKYGMALPVEFEVLLDQDEEGSALFHRLTPGKQRSLLHIIGKPKREETRIRKGVLIMEYLKICGDDFDFRAMYDYMKGR